MPAIIATVMIFLAVSAGAVTADTSTDEVNAKVRPYVENIGDQVMDILTREEIDKAEKREKLAELFRRTVDIDWIARFVLPRHWRTMSDEQKTSYLKYYRRQLIENYVSKFEDYKKGIRFKILRVIPERKNEYLVAMKIIRPGEEPIMAEYRVRNYGGDKGLKVFDIIVEGASLISAQRSEYTSIANSNGVDYLIAQLAAKSENSGPAAEGAGEEKADAAAADSASNIVGDKTAGAK